jgi:hypothetical protein
MASPGRPVKGRLDSDGVRIQRAPRGRRDVWVVVLLGLVVIGGLLASRRARQGTAEVPPTAAAGDAALRIASEQLSAPALEGAEPPRPEGTASPTRSVVAARLRQARKQGAEKEQPSLEAKDVIPLLQAAGERGGIAAFPPPGTDPVKRGIVVPDDFPLPPGYVRHHQTTDDGESLPAILLLHPDYELVDERGNAVPLPQDRVVPPEMAPPGLPIRMLEPPADRRAP